MSLPCSVVESVPTPRCRLLPLAVVQLDGVIVPPGGIRGDGRGSSSSSGSSADCSLAVLLAVHVIEVLSDLAMSTGVRVARYFDPRMYRVACGGRLQKMFFFARSSVIIRHFSNPPRTAAVSEDAHPPMKQSREIETCP